MISGCVRELRSGSIVAVFHPPHSSRCFKSAENFFQQSIGEFASLGVGQHGREGADVQRHSSWMGKCFMHFYRLLTRIPACKRKVLRNEKFRLYFFRRGWSPLLMPCFWAFRQEFIIFVQLKTLNGNDWHAWRRSCEPTRSFCLSSMHARQICWIIQRDSSACCTRKSRNAKENSFATEDDLQQFVFMLKG